MFNSEKEFKLGSYNSLFPLFKSMITFNKCWTEGNLSTVLKNVEFNTTKSYLRTAFRIVWCNMKMKYPFCLFLINNMFFGFPMTYFCLHLIRNLTPKSVYNEGVIIFSFSSTWIWNSIPSFRKVKIELH